MSILLIKSSQNDYYLSGYLKKYTNHIRFKDGQPASAALRSILDILTFKLSKADHEQSADEITKQMCKQLEEMKTDPEYIHYFRPFDELANQMATSIANAFNLIRYTIRPEVEELRKEINELIEQELKRTGNETILTNGSGEINSDLDVVDWSVVNLFSSESEIRQEIRESQSIDIGFQSIRRSANILSVDVQKIVLSEDERKDTIDRILARKPVLDREVIGQFVDALCDSYSMSLIANRAKLKLAATSNDVNELLMAAQSMIATFGPIKRVFDAVEFDLPSETYGKLRDNGEVFRKLLVVACAYVIFAREYYKDSLVIPPASINPDVFSKAQQENITQLDIAEHIKAFYTNLNVLIPTQGIPTDIIISKKTTAREMIAIDKQKRLLNSEVILTTATISSARIVLTKYLRHTDKTRIPENMDIDTFVRLKTPLVSETTSMINSAGGSPEDALFEFVIRCWYPDVVLTIHRLFKKYLLNRIDEETDISGTDKHVAATIMAECLLDGFISVTPVS